MHSFRALFLFGFGSLGLFGCTQAIQHGLEERDANEIVTALVARGYSAQKVSEKGKKPTWAIEVAEEHAIAAMGVLTELKLPRQQRLKTLALAQSGGLIDTPGVERLRQLEAQEGDIEESLETMDGVVSAAVELVVSLPPRPGLSPSPSRASVLLRSRPEAVERLQQQRAELKAYVAGAVDSLSSDSVVLVIDAVNLDPSGHLVPLPAGSSTRVLVVALGATLSLLAGLLVFLSWKLLRSRAHGSPEPMPQPMPRPPEVPAEAPRQPKSPVSHVPARKVA